MKIQLRLFRLERPTGAPQDFDIPAPGYIRGTAILWEKAPVILANGDPNAKLPIACMVVEVDPDAPLVRRRFHLAIVGGVLESAVADAPEPTFHALLQHPMFGPLGLYEDPIGQAELTAIAAQEAEAKEPKPDDRPAPINGEIVMP